MLNFESKVKQQRQDFFLEANMPDVEGLTKKQIATLFKADGNSVDFDENGQPYPTRFGKKVTDNMEKPIPFDTYTMGFVEKNSWGTKLPGKGGGDDKPNDNPRFKNKNEAFAYMEKNKIEIDSKQGEELLKEFE